MAITYRSTRGKAPELGFADVLLAGLATDGGLYVPTEIPELAEGITDELSYSEIAVAVIWPFVEGSIERADFVAMVTDTYRGFSDPAVAPVFDLGHNQWLCDLSYGPTLAF